MPLILISNAHTCGQITYKKIKRKCKFPAGLELPLRGAVRVHLHCTHALAFKQFFLSFGTLDFTNTTFC